MERIEVQVLGSGESPYRVTFEKFGSRLRAFCTCAAGANGQACKHRLRLLSGNPEGVVDLNSLVLTKIVDWVVGTDVEQALEELARSETRLLAAKKDVEVAKKRLSDAFRS